MYIYEIRDKEMSPPPYSDLGKRANDVFGKGYHFGLIKLDCKTKTGTGVEFNTGGTSNQETGKIFGSLETKYRVKDYGVTFTEKWTTDNTLGTEISVQDQLVQGLKVSGNIDFSPQTGNKSGAVKSAFLHEKVAINADAKLASSGPIVEASAVVGYQGWLAGYKAAFDTQKNKLTQNNFALGFSTTDFVLHTTVPQLGPQLALAVDCSLQLHENESESEPESENSSSEDGQKFGGSIYQRINPKLESAIQLSWASGSNNTKFGIGAKYDLDEDAAIRAKVDNASLVGLGYQQRLREGVTLTLSLLIDAANFNNGGHKIGLALDLEA
ncbi:hypothetical protein NQ315_014516 [Exocentrus adspersus]|uniref:Voltage-dependent anion-selective channel n=1 Tax=Exocentrus adspersus TaxID=1586481 RepID=A0AAV8V9K1_9CUCU|nr:hypothetical protein NQ315_014516 [Exocentrus adspersus]